MATDTPEMSCKTCYTPLDGVTDNRCPGCGLTFYVEHPGSYLRGFRICCPKCERLLSPVEKVCPGCGHPYALDQRGTYIVGTKRPRQHTSFLGALDLHVLFAEGLALLPCSVMVGHFARFPLTDTRRRLLFAVAVGGAVFAPGLIALTHVLEAWRFAPGQRWRYAATNGLLLALGAAWLAWLVWWRPAGL